MTPPLPPGRAREARLFRNNRSQAVRIPAEFEMPGDRVLISRQGDKLILEPVSPPETVAQFLADLRANPLAPEDWPPEIEDPIQPPEDFF